MLESEDLSSEGLNFIKEDSDTGVPVKFGNFLRKIILKNVCERLLPHFI